MNSHPDVVLLDLGLPDVDGLQVLAMLRAVSDMPVIVITAQDDDAALVSALDSGADDYVIKPFGLDQVAARIRAVLRRGGAADGSERSAGRRRTRRSTYAPGPRRWTATPSSCRARSSTCCSCWPPGSAR